MLKADKKLDWFCLLVKWVFEKRSALQGYHLMNDVYIKTIVSYIYDDADKVWMWM